MEQTLRYLETAHPAPDPLLLELEQHGRKDGVPVVSRETGRLLSTVVHAMQASRILEIGTGYGCSTLWMALAQPRMGRIWTVDPEPRRTEIAISYFKRAGEDDYIEIFNTPTLDLLNNFPQRNLDIVFVDANPVEYRTILDLTVPMLKLSGLVIVDDCLMGGRVAAPPSRDDDAALAAMRDFNEYFLSHPDLDATILPLGNGTGIGARKR
ncbi:MAG: O-methyltransferase [Candidatus Eremiobacteraeota bacterium]|nr:O-methyltransferase [Candidatus Eremiobacteraeota bacterium]